ncbi:hypothetical protein M408DRAFT_320998 [Serendipita vermifera MAFF 305830]|uniref:Uncharacterized protein n=1 Tax=Serendipita vermifera MAFF 305830 TaxID=933852 RepID=A0A0C2X1V0_SERVB|nr:hypothetical protein M408DRAFT_320998 [Serendipita vermifera MAFF 305830]
MGNCLSKDQATDAEAIGKKTIQAVVSRVVKEDPKEAPEAPKSTNILASERPDMNLKEEEFDPAKAKAVLDMGIQVIDLFEKTANVAGMVFPSPVGDILKKVTSVLGVLKDEKGSMDGYMKQLASAMDKFRFMLEIFVGFTVDEMRKGVDSLTSDVRAIGSDIKDVRNALANQKMELMPRT